VPEFYLRSYPLPDDVRAHARAAEDDGWDGLLLTDTQNLSMDVVGSLYLAASVTSRLRLGTAVTNLVTRHPAVVASTFATLHHISGGRAHIGVGRGDTALELVGIRPPSAHEFEQQIGRLQTYLRGGVVDVDGFGSRITWLPLTGDDVAGEGKVPAHFQRGSRSALSTADAAVVTDVTAHYDNYHHGLEHAAQSESLSDDFLRRFCVVGSPDECVERLRGLIASGLSHVTVVGGSRDIDPAVRQRSDHLMAKEVLPALSAP
jgi:alkanesulfonate monooxygenase SsuD/methylene tetrahydromethanopterin reductase-like flavin-dependent oxidoreductase (luciferase family)